MSRRGPAALAAVSLGLVLVAVDFRTEALDLIPDPIGWFLVAYGARRVGVNRAALLAVVAGLLSLSDVHLGFEYVLLDPVTFDVVEACPSGVVCPEELRYLQVGAIRAAVIGAASVVGGAAIVLFLRYLQDRAGSAELRLLRGWLRFVTILVLAAWMAPFVAVVAADVGANGRYQPFWDGGLAYVSPILMGVLIVVAGVIWRASSTFGRTLELS